MSLNIITTTKIEEVAGFVADAILDKLKSGRRVLFFATGGSSIPVCVGISEILSKHKDEDLLENLTVTITDERYGPVDHPDSNYFKLTEKGFNLPEAKMIPFLNGDEHKIATQKLNDALKKEFENAEYKIGLFGVGADGHTAGVLPMSEAVECPDLICGYETPVFSRLTVTPSAIAKLDEAVVFMQGEEKWKVLEDLKGDIDIAKQPAQILKKVPLLTIFSDYNNS